MDEDINRIIKKVFSEGDSKIIEDMLDVVNKDMSDTKMVKRMNDIDLILNGYLE